MKGNKFPSVPLARAANMKESYGIMKLVLKEIQYEKYNRNVCGDLMALLSSLACSLATQRFVAFCASGTAGTENIITSKNSGLNENPLFQDRKM